MSLTVVHDVGQIALVRDAMGARHFLIRRDLPDRQNVRTFSGVDNDVLLVQLDRETKAGRLPGEVLLNLWEEI